MEITSTRSKKKTVKRERPSRRIIDNLLMYSQSLVMFSTACGPTVMIINN